MTLINFTKEELYKIESCILGDGELQEGQIWEGFMLAPKYKLNNLVCFIDYNKSQNDGYVKDILDLGDLKTKINSFGWETKVVDGHNIEEINNSIKDLGQWDYPVCIILNTIKGKGVSFMEQPEWHAKAPNKEEYNNALKELGYESN